MSDHSNFIATIFANPTPQEHTNRVLTADLAATLLTVATTIAYETAQKIAAKRIQLGDLRQYSQTKTSSVDPVTIVDTLAEEYIVEQLAAKRPEDGVIGEEGSDTTSLSGVTWIVDPIDGTVNFIYGQPDSAVSIAAVINGEPVVGVVCQCNSLDMWAAAQGYGAWLQHADGQIEQLFVTQEQSLQQALLATGFSYNAQRRRRQAELLVEVLPQVRDIRRRGSAALDLCAVASGQVDCFYEYGLNPWDYAAGIVIAAEAGAQIHMPPMSTLGASGALTAAWARSLDTEYRALLERLPTQI
ncbi:inositol monophosphatase family protein [Corynebacterium sp. HS2168-gen11]|uniref:inositol monophosphatase family protein n=1 Tax=Corynebacterium sp. HS2168-gen11 TaxID=2974027 RepID=UPI00216AD5AF|nr:inositol monophosphatase family protein [Corynebacterium sp. HS2168-gen11]MCS4535224.1 inositol monophosphatase [Corynebacterium sp. HS2168-gen11]